MLCGEEFESAWKRAFQQSNHTVWEIFPREWRGKRTAGAARMHCAGRFFRFRRLLRSAADAGILDDRPNIANARRRTFIICISLSGNRRATYGDMPGSPGYQTMFFRPSLAG